MTGCYDCKYWAIHGSLDNADELEAECRRYPPNIDRQQPVTNGKTVCGEWISRSIPSRNFLGQEISNSF